MKYVLSIVVIGALAATWYVMAGPGSVNQIQPGTAVMENGGLEPSSQTPTMEAVPERSVVTDGTYTVVAEESIVNWSGKKPLIDGYANTGTLGVTNGIITVAGTEASGDFTIDMNTLDVGLTAKKPGKEGSLEEHLKSDRWFDVATYPTATFKITKVTPRADSATTFAYDITGDLTMKGATHEVTFAATIFTEADGTLHAEAATEIDRTLWGITAGSSNFFDNLADNVIDDMIGLSFSLVAKKS